MVCEMRIEEYDLLAIFRIYECDISITHGIYHAVMRCLFESDGNKSTECRCKTRICLKQGEQSIPRNFTKQIPDFCGITEKFLDREQRLFSSARTTSDELEFIGYESGDSRIQGLLFLISAVQFFSML